MKRVLREAAGPGPGVLRGHGASSWERRGDRRRPWWRPRFLGVQQARGPGEIGAAPRWPEREPGTAASSTFRSPVLLRAARRARSKAGTPVRLSIDDPPTAILTSFPFCHWCAACGGGPDPRPPVACFLHRA
ncbi:hypothetical protein NDU88_004404 [Pleurodeles waltl]|uniref:Uncharacterized protein n=1 Tax=Pleurodeles waltl TaxID=8319 RepID=A0AAV7NKX9_PLEWA|nr:hypothetical protein NDU88_004404 [Pleurodeles waltl]